MVKAGPKKTTQPIKYQKVDPQRSKNYDDELEKIPHYMRERVAYLIDQKVERRVREFMEEFRQEIY